MARGCSFRNHIGNKDVRQDLKIQSVLDGIKEYWQDWKSHVEHVIDMHTPKQMPDYRPSRRDAGNNGQILYQGGTVQ